MSSQSEINDLAEKARGEIVPTKSRKRYNKAYDEYKKWRFSKNISNPTDENTFLAYFQMLSETKAPSTLWSIYSMLKTMLQLKEKCNIENYLELTRFIKRKNDGYKPKQSKTLTSENIQEFINNAPDDAYLAQKVRN